MQCTIGLRRCQRQWGCVVHTIAVLGLVVQMMTGVVPEGLGGWVASPPVVVGLGKGRRVRERQHSCHGGLAWRAGWSWLRRSWMVVAVRSEVLMVLVYLSDRQEWEWVCLLPWLAWLWKGCGVAWPGLGRQRVHQGLGRVWERASSLALIGLGLLWLDQQLPMAEGSRVGVLPVGMSLPSWANAPSVEVERDEEGVYHVQLQGEFELHVDGQVEFYKRMLVIFVGLLEVPGETRGSRRTRDGRTPFVRQEQMAAWFGVPHPVISRWFGYWLKQDWQRMLSQRWGEVLTLEVRRRVIGTWVQFPWWPAQRMWEHLQAQGSAITLNQVKQIGRESGWTALREALAQVYVIGPESFRPRDEWLASQLLGQVQGLVARLEAVGGLTPEEHIAWADGRAMSQALHLRPAVARRPLPWMLHVEHQLFGHLLLPQPGLLISDVHQSAPASGAVLEMDAGSARGGPADV